MPRALAGVPAPARALPCPAQLPPTWLAQGTGLGMMGIVTLALTLRLPCPPLWWPRTFSPAGPLRALLRAGAVAAVLLEASGADGVWVPQGEGRVRPAVHPFPLAQVC